MQDILGPADPTGSFALLFPWLPGNGGNSNASFRAFLHPGPQVELDCLCFFFFFACIWAKSMVFYEGYKRQPFNMSQTNWHVKEKH